MQLIEIVDEGDVLILKIAKDRLDASVAEKFKEEIAGHVKKGNSRIVLDMSDVGFMDSSGLGSIIMCLKQLDRKGEMVLYGITDMVDKLFKLTRVHKVVRIFQTREEAVAALS